MSLDGLADTLKIDKDKNKEFVIKAEDEDSKHLYGIDVSDCKLFRDSKIVGDEKIAAIGIRAKHSDNAAKLIKMFLEQK